MSLTVGHTTVNAHDAHAQARFWGDLLGYGADPDDPNVAGDPECMIYSPDGRHRILFIEVEELAGPGRTHFDLRPTDGDRDRALETALALGARLVADRRTPDGRGWVVLVDPEDNEFCILRSDDERRAAGDPFVAVGPNQIGVGAIPILPMGDPRTSFDWWSRLGFTIEFEHRLAPELRLYAGLAREDARVHLSQHEQDAAGPGTLHLWVANVAPIAQAFGVEVKDNPWGGECHLIDPVGNRIRVGQAVWAGPTSSSTSRGRAS